MKNLLIALVVLMISCQKHEDNQDKKKIIAMGQIQARGQALGFPFYMQLFDDNTCKIYMGDKVNNRDIIYTDEGFDVTYVLHDGTLTLNFANCKIPEYKTYNTTYTYNYKFTTCEYIDKVVGAIELSNERYNGLKYVSVNQ